MGEDWQEVPSRNHRRSNADDVSKYSNARLGSYANVVNGASPGSYGSLLSTSP
nr:hypothetical protein [Tanacetum cinerariifolium]